MHAHACSALRAGREEDGLTPVALAMRFEAEPRLGALLQQLDSKSIPGQAQDDNKEQAIDGKVQPTLPNALRGAGARLWSYARDTAAC